MRTISMRGLVQLALVAALLASAQAVTAADTVTGEIVDMACYIPHPEMGQGAGHRTCAAVCLKKGLPMGLLTDDKQLLLLLEDHDNTKPYAQLKEKAAEKVTVEGERVTRGGVQALVVEAVK